MNIEQALNYIKTQPFPCKRWSQVVTRLQDVLASRQPVKVNVTPFTVILNINGQQEVLCSRFLEQRI